MDHARVRVSLVTGANGSGKTHLLDGLWRTWTGRWPNGRGARRRDRPVDAPTGGALQAYARDDGLVEAEARSHPHAPGAAVEAKPPERDARLSRVRTMVRDQAAACRGQGRLLVLVDEVEQHLDVRAQRRALDAWRALAGDWGGPMTLVASTHSPLVMGAAEAWMDPEAGDQWWHLEGEKATGGGTLREMAFVRRGTADAWLTSEGFDLEEPRGNAAAEAALVQARSLLREGTAKATDVQAAHEALAAALPDIDRFWPRWIHWYEERTGCKA